MQIGAAPEANSDGITAESLTMSGDLELTVVQRTEAGRDAITGLAITDDAVVAVGGTSVVRVAIGGDDWLFDVTPAPGAVHDVLAVGDALWVCGARGLLASTRDRGATWTRISSGSDDALLGLALGSDGAVWCVGAAGYAARFLGDSLRRVDTGTTAAITAAVAVRDEVALLGGDGKLRRWSDGAITELTTGATQALTGLVLAKSAWIVTGVGGFIGRSPDGTWFSRVRIGSDADVTDVTALRDGRLLAVAANGALLVSTDDGRTWTPSKTGASAPLRRVARHATGALIVGDGGFLARCTPSAATAAPSSAAPSSAAPSSAAPSSAAPSSAAPSSAAPSSAAPAPSSAAPSSAELDAALAPGPSGFIAQRLAAYAQAIGSVTHARRADEPEREVAAVLGAAGDAATFAANYGVALPAEAQQLLATARTTPFAELRVDEPLRPDVGSHNLFELMVRRDQAAPDSELVQAFCGVFCIGSQTSGDTFHLELYEWDGPRQVLHFARAERAFSGVVADSLDSFVYLNALTYASARVRAETLRGGLRALRGKCVPSAALDIASSDPEWQDLDAQRRESEFFFYRSRWIHALLRGELAQVTELFQSDLNQVVPTDQLPARYESCEKFIPTALYAMWRAFLFDEPELARYLEIGAAHAARVVRDAAALIGELRAGRTTLGTIRDVPAWLAEFRALGLDPRGGSVGDPEKLAAFESADRAQWATLAWDALADGAVHRALYTKLAQEPELVALDELSYLDDAERAVVVPRLAATLSSEAEALLVGSLVRDDALTLARPEDEVVTDDDFEEDDADEDADESDDDSDGSPGWGAIDAALAAVYGSTKPQHWGTVVPYELGGNDPLPGLSAYDRAEPVPHWHFVTYGFTDLYTKETDDPEESGFGFELTLRIAKTAPDETPPVWALNFLQNLARYVFSSGNRFAAGHKMGLNGPIALENDTKITAVCFADDPELGDIESPFGAARFVQIVGITDDEYKLIQEWTTTGLLDILGKKLPLLVTDLRRDSVLRDPELAREVEQRVAAEGMSEELSFAGEMKFEVDDGRVRIEMGALYAAALPRAMRGRVRHGRGYELRGSTHVLRVEPASAVGYAFEDDELVLHVTQELARELEEKLRDNIAGTYTFAAWPQLEIEMTPSFISAPDGSAIDVKGIPDPHVAETMIAEENERRAASAEHDHDADDDDDGDDDDSDDEDDEDDDTPPSPERVRAALAMSSRALRLAPDDPDVQFTHAMLLMDGDRAEIAGTLDELFSRLTAFSPATRVNVAVRIGQRESERFGEAVDAVLSSALPERILSGSSSGMGGGAMLLSYGDVAGELLGELGEEIIKRTPERLMRFVEQLPDNLELLSQLAFKAQQAEQTEAAMVLYERVLALPIPDSGTERTNYLRALNNACVQAHAHKAYDTAVRIADRAQPIAHENPYIYHSAACAYAAVGNYDKAFEQVKLAVEHKYDHLNKVEVDGDLGPLLEWPEFKALFRDWHARQEGN